MNFFCKALYNDFPSVFVLLVIDMLCASSIDHSELGMNTNGFMHNDKRFAVTAQSKCLAQTQKIGDTL